MKLKAELPYSDRLELFLPPPVNQLGRIGCGGERVFEVPDFRRVDRFLHKECAYCLDGGAPFSVLIPDLNARLGYDIQLLTGAMKPTPASTASAQF
ncbi:hypothetical protein, partial [Sulfitobacter sp. M74]|uniref:hypothetical protein n=1 Tax=Sulfitobacter sp. M74 TaxID=2731177 RepID=UPI0023E15F31